ncbi:MsnO8 family LLM class oxidoreductase [Streptomyces brasiliensis]|uniref:Alkane monooxygenase n=1 Tax=Streptomyces brasiliensis TaxID=1954 RepID=A0A917P6W2_9ACTN|nr:MsnO8 family LLM class oxidoreductase [Streptomyces brasiliensis]GGJ64667.1 alkane monooxygenase [Streptomyces brasiliensis]
MKLSLVELAATASDQSQTEALEAALATARHAEQIGLHRIWFAEHHTTFGVSSHSPEILIAAASRETRRIRLGSGAVLLNHHSPLRVAESFHQLQAMAPDRIDLGLGRATAGPLIDLALQRDRRSEPADDFDSQVAEVLAYYHGGFFADDHPFLQIRLPPTPTNAPDTWVLGSSGSSAGLAAALGLGYAFSAFINPRSAATALRSYRRGFRPASYGPDQPEAILSVNVAVADTDAEARRLTWPFRAFRQQLGRVGFAAAAPRLSEAERMLTEAQKEEPTVIVDGRWPLQLAGSPSTVRDELEKMISASGASEIMIHDLLIEQDARLHSHALLAEALAVAL